MRKDDGTSCCGCCDRGSRFLHSVRYRGELQRFCTCCVLKLHPGSFCVSCFDVFEGPPPGDSARCSKCPAVSHSACLLPDKSPRFTCPSCAHINISFFNPQVSQKTRVIDLTSAKVLLAAAKISSQSMGRAVAAARLEADRKVREAAFARKRAREAIDLSVCAISSSEAAKNATKPLPTSVTVEGVTMHNPSLIICSGDESHVNSGRVLTSTERLRENGLRSTTVPSPQSGLLQSHLGRGSIDKRSLLESFGDDRGRSKGLSDSRMIQLSKLDQDQAVPKSSSGVVGAGSLEAPTLLS